MPTKKEPRAICVIANEIRKEWKKVNMKDTEVNNKVNLVVISLFDGLSGAKIALDIEGPLII